MSFKLHDHTTRKIVYSLTFRLSIGKVNILNQIQPNCYILIGTEFHSVSHVIINISHCALYQSGDYMYIDIWESRVPVLPL